MYFISKGKSKIKKQRAKGKNTSDAGEERQVPMQTELSERILNYGARTIKVVESLPKTLVGRRIGDQLLRSATSVGANFEEAQAAESRDDFVHKLQLALKELRESNYWLRLLAQAGKLPKPPRAASG